MKLIDDIIAREGGYVNNPADKGGPTNYGITEATARANGYTGNMHDLPRSTAVAIYTKQYVAPFAGVNDEVILNELVDTAVNMGVKTSVSFLQRSLRAFGSTITADGAIGPKTIDALNVFLKRSGSTSVLLKMLNCLQGERYIALVEKNPSQAIFLFGWFANRVS